MNNTVSISRSSPVVPRIAPFCIFAAFILSKEIHSALAGEIGLNAFLIIYMLQIALVSVTIYIFYRQYSEIVWNDLLNFKHVMLSTAAAILVFVVWVTFGQHLLVMGSTQSPDLSGIQPDALRFSFIAIRLIGAVIVVPVMEELFWRSFLLRYFVDANFSSVSIGQFTLFSFVCVSLLFGFEHTFVFSGIVAGCAYNLLLYRTKSLSQCIYAHALTNLLLSGYVLYTGEWYFW